MCGIAGFMLPGRNPRYRELESHLHAMIAMLRHRGPDDAGAWTDGRAGLAHARLSVIDLTPAGHQPMASADGNVWISYNGEIYNFREIRRDLEELGYPFRSRGDAEVIANGWHAWGAEVIPRLRGMFAFALWDRRTSRLILARDRIGKKPLYYALSEGALLFGSEIKALLTWPGLSRIPNLSAIDRYLTLGYVPSPHSAFAGISKLPAAHYLVVNARSRDGISDPELVQYWRLPAPNTGTRRRPEELRRELIERLEEAVRLRLISDVPLGAFLSGGIDSSAVVAMMARAGCGRVKTFSIGFSAKEYDETRFARLVAERYGTDHEELVVEPDAVKILPRLVWHYGEPFADASAIPTYYVSEMARRKVAVALNGDGGDECFLGYNRYRAMYHLSRLDRMPHWSRAGIERILALAPNALQRRFKIPQIRGVLRAPEESPAQRYAPTFVSFADRDKHEGYSGAMREHLERS